MFALLYWFVFIVAFTVSLIMIPYIVYRFIMNGDEYSMVSSVFLPIMYVLILSFLINNVFMTSYQFVRCWGKTDGDLIDTTYKSVIRGLYISIYMSFFSVAIYIIGNYFINRAPYLKDILMSVTSLPEAEYFIKGIPIPLGSLLGYALSYLCVDHC